MLGKWKSKTTDLIVKVVKVEKGVVWYDHPAWNFLCDCPEETFRETMERVHECPTKSPTFIQFHRDRSELRHVRAVDVQEQPMSCDKRCFDPESKWHGHEDCDTCPGADKGPRPHDCGNELVPNCPRCNQPN